MLHVLAILSVFLFDKEQLEQTLWSISFPLILPLAGKHHIIKISNFLNMRGGDQNRTQEIAQEVKILDTRTNDLNSIPGNPHDKREN